MKRSIRLTAILTAVIMILSMVICSFADEEDPLYVSPEFKIPKHKIVSDPWPSDPDEEITELAPAEDDSGEQPEEETPAEQPEEETPAEQPEEETPAEQPEEETPVEQPEEETPAEQPEEETPAEQPEEETPAEQPKEETPKAETEPEEEEPVEEEPEEEEPVEEEPVEEEPTEVEEEKPEIPKKVKIYSSRKNVVTEGERIYLTSYLEGFEGLTVTFQWQVDRGDGKGWEDVQGATNDSYSFIATEETILYSWRVIVYYEAD